MESGRNKIERVLLYFWIICFIMVNPPIINLFNKAELIGGIFPTLWVWVYGWYFVTMIGLVIIGIKLLKYIREVE